MTLLRTATVSLATVAALAAGGAGALAVAEPGRDHPEDDGTTTAQTTTTTGSTTTTQGGSTAARAPRIEEIEVEALSRGRLRLETEVEARGARVTSVRFTYRGRTYKGRRGTDGDWSRVVTARGGDRDDRVVRLRVRACAGDRCSTRTGSDDA